MRHAHILTYCKKCGRRLGDYYVLEGGFDTWKAIHLKRQIFCRTCRHNVKIDIQRVE